MMEGGETANRSLDVLPRRISDAHRHLRDAVDTLCLLEGFLFGAQVRDAAPEREKEPPSGVVDKCFDNLTGISNSIEQCHNQLRHIIDKLGAASPQGPEKL